MSKRPSYAGKALLLEIRPIPMMLVMLFTFLGAVIGHLATGIKYPVLLIYMADVASILYLAHLVDTFNDILRKEYQAGYKPRWGFDTLDPKQINGLLWQYIVAFSFTLFLAIALATILVVETGFSFLLFPFIGILLALTYGSGLDKVPILSDITWGLGVIFAFYGGLYIVTQTIFYPTFGAWLGVAILPILIGLKIFDAEPDFEIDKKLGKKTIPTLIGVREAHAAAILLILFGGFGMMQSIFESDLGATKSYLLGIPILLFTILTLANLRSSGIKALQRLALAIIFLLIWTIIILS